MKINQSRPFINPECSHRTASQCTPRTPLFVPNQKMYILYSPAGISDASDSVKLYSAILVVDVVVVSYQSTFLRFVFFSLCLFLKSLLRALAAFEIPVRCLRILGRGQASRTIFCNLSKADLRFMPCVRCSCEVILNKPSLLMRLLCCSFKRRWTSTGIQSWRMLKSNRSSTLVLSLLTFCPPDPEDLTKLISSLSSGMFTVLGTFHTEFRLLLLVVAVNFLFGFLGSYGTYSHIGLTTLFSISFSLTLSLAEAKNID
mmetsp:Transcript_14035/g.28995  ORF Transcript_14035/g.28995 Transcript_14035/m.28995 type:complete len:258 (-) Transcript_14035:7-780(-)